MKLLLLGIILLLGAGMHAAHAQSDIPAWVKNLAGYWVDGLIPDSEFLGAIEYLIQQGIISVPEDTAQPDISRNDGPVTVGAVPLGSVSDFAKMVYPGMQSLTDGQLVDLIALVKCEIGADSDWRSVPYEDLYHTMEDILSQLRDRDLDIDRPCDIETGEEDLYGIASRLGSPSQLDDITFADLYRYNRDYIGDGLFFRGNVVDVVRDINNPSSVDLYLWASGANFDSDDGWFVIVRYDGPYLVESDEIVAFGSVVGLEIRDWNYINTVALDVGLEKAIIETRVGSLAGRGNQVQIPVIDAARIQILTEPHMMRPNEMDRIAMELEYDQLKQHCKVPDNMILRYEGRITQDHETDRGEETSFAVNISGASHGFERIEVQYDLGDELDYERDDRITIYGTCVGVDGSGNPVISAIHVE